MPFEPRLLRVPVPSRLDTDLDPVALPADAANQLKMVDLVEVLGRARRGRGVSRAQGVSGVASVVQSAGVFTPRGCHYLAVDSLANGTVRAHPSGNEYVQDDARKCFGFLPEFVDYPEDDGACCEGCLSPFFEISAHGNADV